MVIYTLENQLLTELPVELFLKQNDIWIRFRPEFNIYPFQYYGQGTDVDLDVFDSYDASFFRLQVDAFQKTRGIFIGPRYRLIKFFDIEATSENGIITDDLFGFEPKMVSGLGVGLLADHRNNIFAPSGGYFVTLNAIHYDNWLGSTYQFTDLLFDARKYFRIQKTELAFQAYHNSIIGDVPFYNLARLGGSDRMRGYFEGAYRDNHYSMIQGEFRFYPIKDIFLLNQIVFSTFAGIGSVGDQLFEYEKLLPSGGIGFRFEIDPEEKIRIRADFAFGPGTTGFYLNINEAF
jgi:outer membrane protein assembly factor BamA